MNSEVAEVLSKLVQANALVRRLGSELADAKIKELQTRIGSRSVLCPYTRTHIKPYPNDDHKHECPMCIVEKQAIKGHARGVCFCSPPVECPPMVYEKGVGIQVCSAHPDQHRFHTHFGSNGREYYSTFNDESQCIICILGSEANVPALLQSEVRMYM